MSKEIEGEKKMLIKFLKILSNRGTMLLNYMKVAIRNLKNNKGYSLINIFGLAVGITCCILILLYIQNELSYDHYNKNIDQIYRVRLSAKIGNNELNLATSCAPCGT